MFSEEVIQLYYHIYHIVDQGYFKGILDFFASVGSLLTATMRINMHCNILKDIYVKERVLSLPFF